MKSEFIEIKGVAGTLRVYEDKLSITPRGVMGFLNKGLKGTKEIPFHAINAIQLKKAGILNGYIQFTISGGKESRGGFFSALDDENTFVFASAENETIERTKQFIEERIKATKAPAPASASTSKVEQLEKLAALKASGAISEQDYQKLKDELIAKGM